MQVIQIPARVDDGFPAIVRALVQELRNGGAVLMHCTYCGNVDGPFQFVINTPNLEMIVETPFEPNYRDLYVSHCRDCLR